MKAGLSRHSPVGQGGPILSRIPSGSPVGFTFSAAPPRVDQKTRVGVLEESAVRKSTFSERCVVAVVLVLLLGVMTGVAFALLDHEPRAMRTGLLLPTGR
jgi:hypothetical protein